MFDTTTSRLKLPISEVYQFDSNVMYMPAALEVYAYIKFIELTSNWVAGDEVTPAMKWLLMLKLRYVDSAAGGQARQKLDLLNTQNALSAQCDTSDTASFSLSTRANWGQTIMDAAAPAGTREGMCYYAAIINTITQLCQVALNRDIINGLRKACDEAYKAVMQKVSNLCTGDCDRSMLQGFLCTSVNAAVGGGCTSMDVMSQFLGTQCSAYQTFIGAYCSNIGMYTGSGFGYSPMSGMYYSSYAFNPFSGYYGSGTSNIGSGFSGYSYSSYYYFRKRQLSASSYCGDQQHAFSTACLEYVDSSPSGVQYLAVDSSVGSAVTVLDSNDDETYYAHAMAKLSHAYWHLSPEGGLPASLVTLALDELVFQRATGSDNSTIYALEVVVSVGKFLATTGAFYGEAEKIPIFPICDAEFEESVVRDAVQVASVGDSDNSIPCTPYSGGKTLKAVRHNIDIAEKRFKSLPLSNFIGGLGESLVTLFG
jgi:hypothetical protein